MSQGLQDKFQAMEQTWDQARTTAQRSETAAASSEAAVAAADEQDTEGEDSQEHQNKKRKLAIETAFAIESEVQKWQRGIAELEAMLEETSADVEDAQRSSSSSSSSFLPDGDALARPPEVVRFPSLPPIIPAEEGDLEWSRGSTNHEDEGENSGKEDY